MQSLAIAWSMDSRSLAALRIGLGLILLVDLGQRYGSRASLLSEKGLLPVEALVSEGLVTWPLSALTLGFGDAYVWASLVVGGLAALALVFGWRSRLAALVGWLALVVVQTRNPLINFGSDAVVRLVLLLAAFLPTGDHWSFDARSKGVASGVRYLSPMVVALRVQVAAILFIAGWAKFRSSDWLGGSGVLRAFDHELLAGPLAAWLIPWDSIVGRPLTYLTIGLEVGIGLLVLLPVLLPRIWGLAIVAAAAMFLGFSATLRVGLFPAGTFVVLLPFVPGEFWDWLARNRPTSSTRVRTPGRGWSALQAMFVGPFVAFVLAWNVGLWRDAGYEEPLWMQGYARLFQLHQKWGMFTRIPSTGWLVVPGTLRDGTRLNLLRDGGPLPKLREDDSTILAERRPADVSGSFANIRWRAFFVAMTESPEGRDLNALWYGRYLCREWNRRYAEGKPLESLEIVYHHREPRSDPAQPIAYTRTVLWTHWCFG